MSVKFWRWLFGGCEHRWVILHEFERYFAWDSGDKTKILGLKIISRCEKCGKLRNHIL